MKSIVKKVTAATTSLIVLLTASSCKTNSKDITPEELQKALEAANKSIPVLEEEIERLNSIESSYPMGNGEETIVISDDTITSLNDKITPTELKILKKTIKQCEYAQRSYELLKDHLTPQEIENNGITLYDFSEYIPEQNKKELSINNQEIEKRIKRCEEYKEKLKQGKITEKEYIKILNEEGIALINKASSHYITFAASILIEKNESINDSIEEDNIIFDKQAPILKQTSDQIEKLSEVALTEKELVENLSGEDLDKKPYAFSKNVMEKIQIIESSYSDKKIIIVLNGIESFSIILKQENDVINEYAKCEFEQERNQMTSKKHSK